MQANELYDGRRTTETKNGNRAHTRTFSVDTADPTITGRAVLAASGLPSMYSQHPGDGGALLLGRDAEPVSGSQTHWVVTCRYDTDLGNAIATIPGVTGPAGGGGGAGGGGSGGGGSPAEQANENPLMRPPDIQFSSVRYQEAVEVDMDGTALVNTAWERYDPPPVRDKAHLALDITKNVSRFDPTLISRMIYGINEEAFLGHEIDEVLLDDLRAKPKWENNYFFWEVSARFVFNPIIVITTVPLKTTGGWYLRLLNVGFMTWDATDLVQRRIRLPDGSYPSRPQSLTSAGGIRDQSLPPLVNVFRLQKRVDMSSLGLF